MTKKEFMMKWLTIDPHSDTAAREGRLFMKDLNSVIRDRMNPLYAGITNAIFELQHAYNKGGKAKWKA